MCTCIKPIVNSIFVYILLQSLSSLLHLKTVFEVGVSESLKDHVNYFNLDFIDKVPNPCVFYVLFCALDADQM